MNCPACPPERARIPRRPRVCDACRSRLLVQLEEIPELVADLSLRQLEVDLAPRRLGRDPVAELLPAASIASRRGQRVTGSKEKPAPISTTILDLTSKARAGTVHDGFRDQYGEHPAASVLDQWVRELRVHRRKYELLPWASVPALVSWLTGERLEDACDDFPAIGEMATEIRRLRSVLRAQLGLIAYDDELKDGVACPKCDTRAALHQANGSEHIECGACGVLLTVNEFNAWASLLAAQVEWLRGLACAACSLNRMYRLRATDELPRCGWCDAVQEEVA